MNLLVVYLHQLHNCFICPTLLRYLQPSSSSYQPITTILNYVFPWRAESSKKNTPMTFSFLVYSLWVHRGSWTPNKSQGKPRAVLPCLWVTKSANQHFRGTWRDFWRGRRSGKESWGEGMLERTWVEVDDAGTDIREMRDVMTEWGEDRMGLGEGVMGWGGG